MNGSWPPDSMAVQGIIRTEPVMWQPLQALSAVLQRLKVYILSYETNISKNEIPAARPSVGVSIGKQRQLPWSPSEAYVAVYVTVASWLPVIRHPIRLQVSPCTSGAVECDISVSWARTCTCHTHHEPFSQEPRAQSICPLALDICNELGDLRKNPANY